MSVYSSENAVKQITRRELRDRTRGVEVPLRTVTAMLEPFAMDFIHRGKIPRGKLRQPVNTLVATIRQNPSIVKLNLHTLASPLSPNESYEITYMQAYALEDSRWLNFLATKVTLSRHYVDVYISDPEFRVSDHVLQRYMQREQRPLNTFYSDIMRPMRVALPVGGNVAYRDPPIIALPFSSGLLLGDVLTGDVTKVGHMALTFRFDKNGATEPNEVPSNNLLHNTRVNFSMKTFIDGDSLNDGKDLLHKSLLMYEKENPVALDSLFDMFVFDRDFVGNRKEAEQAIVQAHALVNSPIWDKFLEGRS